MAVHGNKEKIWHNSRWQCSLWQRENSYNNIYNLKNREYIKVSYSYYSFRSNTT